MSSTAITVILPCLNEAESLPAILAALPDGYRALVVDNNSTDGTAAVARAHGAEVVTECQPGYGAAVHAGVLAARTPTIAVLDADGSLDPRSLPYLVEAVDRGADLAVGRRRAV
ncbi:glycosyltransferase family 2 protein, partial [Mycobacterium kansasii]